MNLLVCCYDVGLEFEGVGTAAVTHGLFRQLHEPVSFVLF